MTSSPKLTYEEQQRRQKARAILAELIERKVAIPPELIAQMQGMAGHKLKKDENGYFLKRDGSHFRANAKQAAFVASTARYIGLFAGRGCVAPETLIDGCPIADRDVVAPVWTVFGRRSASKSYLKGTADLYRVRLDGGNSVICTLMHKFLSPVGWKHLFELRTGDCIAVDHMTEFSVRMKMRDGEYKRSANVYFDPISSIKFERHGEFYDITVPDTAHYAANGIFHHNSGKTTSGAQKALKKIEIGMPGMIINPDFENLKISTWPEFREWIDWNTVVPKHKHMANIDWSPNKPFEIAFNTGSRVILKGIKDPDSARGPNINWLWFDEPGRGDPEGLDWQLANAGVRVGHDPQAWATGTPNGRDHWMYRFFVEKDIPKDAVEAFEADNPSGRQLIEYIFTSIQDNKDNLDPSFYAAMLAAYPDGWLRKQELEGLFVERGGVLGHREWFDDKIIPDAPDHVEKRIRFWDLAASEKKIIARKGGRKDLTDPDSTVGTLLSKLEKNYYIEDMVGGQMVWKDIKELIKRTALQDGPLVRIYVEQEPGSGGINQVAALAEWLKQELPEWPTIEGCSPEGDKIVRSNPWFAEASKGHFWLVKGNWNETFLGQLSSFPIGRHDDYIDSVSGARLKIAPVFTWKRIPFLKV